MSQKREFGKVQACSIAVILLIGLSLSDRQSGASSQQADKPISGFKQQKPEGKKENPPVKNQELEQLKELSSSFQEMGDYYLSKAKDPKDREAVLKLMGDHLKKLSIELQKATKVMACPPGQIKCPDNSCVKSKEKCSL
jgi:hypothetical protein